MVRQDLEAERFRTRQIDSKQNVLVEAFGTVRMGVTTCDMYELTINLNKELPILDLPSKLTKDGR